MTRTLRENARAAVLRLTRFPFLYVILVAAYAAAAGGLVGTTYGLHNLFIEDSSSVRYTAYYFLNSPSLHTQVCISLAILFAWSAPALLDDALADGTLAQRLRAYLRFDFPAMLALNVAVGGGVLLLQLSEVGAGHVRYAQIEYSLSGFAVWLAISTVLTVIALAGASYTKLRPAWIFLFVYTLILAGAMEHGKLVPAVSLFLLLSLIALVYLAIKLLPEHLRLLAILTLVALLVVGYTFSKRSEFDGIADKHGNSYYAHRVKLEAHTQSDAEGLAPVAVLEAWKKTLGDRQAKLVIVATSGGAYRAAFWTSIVLDELVSRSASRGPLAGFDRSIRLMTGASGGMVGAAYFVAATQEGPSPRGSISEKLASDIAAGHVFPAEFWTLWPIPRDTLSQVAQQLIQRDVPGSLLPWMAKSDRGRTLESSWRTLDATFANLLPGEAAGWRPSLILSPMVVETGAPLLISNLNLSEMSSEGSPYLTFFQLFPGSRDSFRLRTAVRMNATFPYASPIVALPTEPTRRVIDAGYFENFGIATTVQFLRMPSVVRWIKENVAAIALVQIRSSRMEATVSEHIRKPECKGLIPVGDEPGPFDWLTGPVEALAASREVSMFVRNQQELSQLRDLYGNDLITTVAFENTARSSLSWYLPQTEFDCLLDEVKSDYNAASFRALETWWNTAPAVTR
jgi:hypothetical protein